MKKITITPAQRASLLQTGRVTIRRPIYKGPTVEQFDLDGITESLMPRAIPCEWYSSMIVERGVEVIGPEVYGFLHPFDLTKAWKSPFGAPGDKIHLIGDGWAYIETINAKLARSRYVWQIGLKFPDHDR